MLSKLGDNRGLWSNPWRINGDFNVVRFPREEILLENVHNNEAFFRDN